MMGGAFLAPSEMKNDSFYSTIILNPSLFATQEEIEIPPA